MNFDDDSWAEDDFDDFKNARNQRYGNAYGNYMGGYGGPGRGPPRLGPPHLGPPRFGPPRHGPPYPRPPLGFGPNPPMMPPFGFGPPPNRDNRASKFLLRCGLALNTVKNLPEEVLSLIQPESCGLCGQDFDSFSVARVHYLSKNHQKNQKKWIAQKIDLRLVNPKETPMKARELYCELCDVQITSKAHADSHYAGKNHRSIVEGNKRPKNPLLLQPGMERRAQQLIRREKKHIGTKKPEDDEASTSGDPAKPVPPELYCEICKAAVTCTEQMTAHLNGKRHLTKEKQYILKQMSGEVDKDDNYEDEGNDQTEENEETQQFDGDENNENVDGEGDSQNGQGNEDVGYFPGGNDWD